MMMLMMIKSPHCSPPNSRFADTFRRPANTSLSVIRFSVSLHQRALEANTLRQRHSRDIVFHDSLASMCRCGHAAFGAMLRDGNVSMGLQAVCGGFLCVYVYMCLECFCFAVVISKCLWKLCGKLSYSNADRRCDHDDCSPNNYSTEQTKHKPTGTLCRYSVVGKTVGYIFVSWHHLVGERESNP